MEFAMIVAELEENGQLVGHAMEVAYVIGAMGGVALTATILGFAIIVTEQVKNGMNAGYVMEQVNVTTATDKDGKRAPIAMVKGEKPALNVVETVSWRAHFAMAKDGICALFVMEKGEECKLVH